MVNEDLIERLDEHEKRIAALESLLTKPKLVDSVKDKKTLSDHIIELRGKGFFTQPKISEVVHVKIQEKYPCELNRVAVALIRLAEKKQLRKASKEVAGKKYKAYAW
jgi:hypothetical protein